MMEADNKVYVIDDDEDLARSLARLFQRRGWSSQAFTDPDTFFDAYLPAGGVCVVTDVDLGKTDGFALAERLSKRDPAAGLLFITAWPTTSHAVDAVRRWGGVDYVEKPIDLGRLLASVATALEASHSRRLAGDRLATLSARERQVFDLVVQGLPNKAVAAELDLSIKTVEAHRGSMMGKLRAQGLAELIALSRAAE